MVNIVLIIISIVGFPFELEDIVVSVIININVTHIDIHILLDVIYMLEVSIEDCNIYIIYIYIQICNIYMHNVWEQYDQEE